MLHKKQDLSKFQDLMELGLKPNFAIGSRLGRGFADLGFEEYLVLSGDRLASLLTGTIAQIQEHEKGKLFSILNVDEMLVEIHAREFDVLNIETQDQRSWTLTMRGESGKLVTLPGSSILEVCTAALRYILERSK